MTKLLALLLATALVSAQGSHFCVHMPDANGRGAERVGFIHYESDSDLDKDTGKDFKTHYISQGLDSAKPQMGISSAFVFLLISLLLVARVNRLVFIPSGVTLLPSEGCRLRPPLRAPPF